MVNMAILTLFSWIAGIYIDGNLGTGDYAGFFACRIIFPMLTIGLCILKELGSGRKEHNGHSMKLIRLDEDFTVCKISDTKNADLDKRFCFLGKTDEEISLVCITSEAPEDTIEREDGWRAFKLEGVLDFSLKGILSGISSVLAENKIGVFAVSTFNTDYIFVKKEDFERALSALASSGWEIA